MPTVLRIRGYRLFFFSLEGNEPPHIHIEKGEATAKIWLQAVEIENNYGFNTREMAQIQRIITENRITLIQSWHDYFN